MQFIISITYILSVTYIVLITIHRLLAKIVRRSKMLSFLSPSRYSFEGTLQAIYGLDRGELDCDENHCIFRDGTDVLKEMDVEDAKFYIDFIVLCAFFVVLRGGCYLVLRWRVKAQR